MGGGGRGSPQDSGDKRTNGGRAGLSSTAHATAPGRGLVCSVLRKTLCGALAGNEANPEDPGGPRSRQQTCGHPPETSMLPGVDSVIAELQHILRKTSKDT